MRRKPAVACPSETGSGPVAVRLPLWQPPRRGPKLATLPLALAMWLTAGGVLAVLGFLLYFCRPLLQGRYMGQILSWQWQPFAGQFGILPMMVGSLLLTVSAVLLALPLTLGLCGFCHGVGRGWTARLVLLLLQLMSGIPTVVYGFVSVFVLVPRLRLWLGGSGYSWAAAALTLSLLILPTMVLLLHTQLRQLEAEHKLVGAALGLTPVQEFIWLRLPQASRGLTAALVLGWGRALGDTLIALMLSGNAPQIPTTPADSIRVLTAHIALVVATDVGSPAYGSIFASGLLLYLVTAAINLAWRRIKSSTEPAPVHAAPL